MAREISTGLKRVVITSLSVLAGFLMFISWGLVSKIFTDNSSAGIFEQFSEISKDDIVPKASADLPALGCACLTGYTYGGSGTGL